MNPKETPAVIFIGGLGDNTEALEKKTQNYNKYGLTPVVYQIDWLDGGDFEPKLEGLVEKVDELKTIHDKISVV